MHAKRTWVAVAVGLVALAIPTSAGAATTVGETSPLVSDCYPGDSGLVQSQVAGPPDYTVPFDGVLTSFTAWVLSPGAQLKLLVLNPPASGDLYNVAAKSAFATSPAVGLSTFPVQVPARAGQEIAQFGTPCYRDTTSSQDQQRQYVGQEPPQGSDAPFSTLWTSQRLVLSATLEPDCDSDGFGDETQDPSVLGGSCPLRRRTLSLDASKNKVKKGKKVKLSGQLTELVRQGECQATQTVELQRKKPSQTVFATVEQLQTTAAGSFSTERKVKKTFEYRAVVIESAECQPGLSNSEKVKVKKKK
jgi:hypothetical protein